MNLSRRTRAARSSPSTIRSRFAVVLAAAFAFTMFSAAAAPAPEAQAAAPAFAYGADLGWLKQLEDEGSSWVNASGVKADPVQLLKDKGINSVRLRVFVNPPSNSYWLKDGTTMTMLGYTDAPRVMAAAKRAQALGMSIMLDFHYSDVFADPGHQIKPAAWNNYTDAQLLTAVYNHTFDVMTLMAQNGVSPDWVQVGNEINPGILLPNGSVNNFAKLTALLNRGFDAVKAVAPAAKVITHVALSGNNAASRSWYDRFFQQGGKTDIIGTSYYPYWDGKPYWEAVGPMAANMTDLAARYNKEVMIVEVGGNQNDPVATYWTVKGAIDAMKAVPNGKGTGVFYWEPEANSNGLPDGYALGATTQVSPKVYRFTAGLDAFSAAPAPNPNLVTNPGFETGGAAQVPSGWTTWSNANDDANFTEAGGHAGSYRLSHWKATAYQVSSSQLKTGLANGAYTMKAWVRSSGGFTTNQMYVKGFGGTERIAAIPTTGTWTQIAITGINVVNGSAELGFWTVTSGANNNWANIDDVEFYKE